MSKRKANSRQKGAAGEREVAALLRRFGFQARRGQQFAGGGDSPDVVADLEGFHIEVKRVESFQLYKSMEQAKGDAREGDTPLVFHRRSREDWVVIVPAEEFLQLLTDYVFEETEEE